MMFFPVFYKNGSVLFRVLPLLRLQITEIGENFSSCRAAGIEKMQKRDILTGRGEGNSTNRSRNGFSARKNG